jgi:hypothetical protein
MDTFVWIPTADELLKEKLFELGWEWVPDTHHPTMLNMNKYDQMISLHAIGWYVKEGHPQKSRRVGDSKPRYVAARIVERAYL